MLTSGGSLGQLASTGSRRGFVDLEHMEFDFETGDVVEAGVAEPSSTWR